MQRTTIIFILCLSFVVLFILICTLPVEPLTIPPPHAFISDEFDITDSVFEEGALAVCDTIHPGDSLAFIGILGTTDARIEGWGWNFGDGENDTLKISVHTYRKSGIYRAVFSNYSKAGDTLSDTVVVCVNTPPVSVTRISPPDGSRDVPVTATLSWEAEDDDDFDSLLSYTVIIIDEGGTIDTILKWADTDSVTLDDNREQGTMVKWIVIARDRFGETVAGDTGSFSLKPDDNVTLSNITLSGKNLTSGSSPADTFFVDTVEDGVTTAELSITAGSRHAMILINDSAIGRSDSTVTLQLPDLVNTFAIKVIAADSVHSKTYIVQVVRRPGSNALLSSLEVSAGNLSPVFAAVVFSYADTVVLGTSSLIVTPTAQDSTVTIEVNGSAVKSGHPSKAAALKQNEENEIAVKVTSPDGTTEKVYKITIVLVSNLPSAPSDVVALSKDTSTILLTWKDNSAIETGFEITRSLTGDTGFSVVGTVNANTSSFTDTGLQDGGEYFYSVRALGAGGASEFSATASAVTKVYLNLTIYRSVGGTVAGSPAKSMFDKGDTVTITATATSGNHFTGWSGDVTGSENPLMIVMDSSMHIEASFLNRPPSFEGLHDTTATAGIVLEFTVVAHDPDGDPLTLLSGTLPAGASFTTATGQFQWTPAKGQTGTHTVTFAATDGQHTTTDSAIIAVYALPRIDSQSVSMIRCTGERAKMSVTAGGSAPIEFLWRKDGSEMEGANACSLVIASVKSADAGIYECMVSNSAGNVTGSPCTLAVRTPVSVIDQPADLIKCPGDSAVFSVAAAGTAPLAYQWRKNGNDIDGQTGTSITLSGIALDDTGAYACRVINGCAEVSSDTATLTVTSPSVKAEGITASAATICPGAPVTLTINGGSLGTGASWKWYAESCGGPSAGTGPALTVTPASTTTYYVRAEGSCNTTECISAVITVKTESKTPTGISTAKTTICLGDSTVLSVDGGSLGSGAAWEWYSGSCTGGSYLAAGASIVVKPSATTAYSLRGKGDCTTTDWRCITITVSAPSVAPTAATTGKSIICKGDSTTLTVAEGSLGTDATWRWYSGSCAEENALGGGFAITVRPDATTVYFVRAEGDCNVTSCADVTVFVDSLSIAPTGISAPAAAVCPDAAFTLTVNGGKLGTGAKWKWYKESCGGTPIDSGVSINVSQTSPTTYYIRAEGTCNTTNCASVDITMKTGSVAPIEVIAGPSVICPRDTATLILNGGTPGTGAQWHWYTGSCGGTPVTPVGFGTSIKVTPEVTTEYFVRAEGDCGNTECKRAKVTVKPFPSTPTSISPSVTICPDNKTTLAVGGPAIDHSFQHWAWYIGSISGSPTNSDQYEATAGAPGITTTYYVRMEDDCGNFSSGYLSTTVTTRQLPSSPTSISPAVTICNGDKTTLTVGGPAIDHSFQHWAWYIGSISGSPTNSDQYEATAGAPGITTTYYVRMEDDCGNFSSGYLSTTVTAIDVPSTPTGISPSAITLCSGGTARLTATGSIDHTYQHWTWYSGGQCGNPSYRFGTGDYIDVNYLQAGTYAVRAEDDCGNSSTGCQKAVVTYDSSPYCRSSVSNKSISNNKTLSKSYQIGDFE